MLMLWWNCISFFGIKCASSCIIRSWLSIRLKLAYGVIMSEYCVSVQKHSLNGWWSTKKRECSGSKFVFIFVLLLLDENNTCFSYSLLGKNRKGGHV